MINEKLKLSTGLILIVSFAGLSGCSVMSKVGKTARNLTTFGSNKTAVAIDEKLIIPPSLKQPATTSSKQAPKKPTTQAQDKPNQPTARKAVSTSSKKYYIVVGTYADQTEALDTFVRLSSIGLKGATMESRVTKGGKNLHMVRLGPYTKQDDIDRAKDSLTSDGLSQFKVVES
jgi:cell division protein FtsN